MKRYVVVKFNDMAKYAQSVFASCDLEECQRWAAKARGLYKGYNHLAFGIYDAEHYAMCQHLENNGLGDLYSLLATTNYSCVTQVQRIQLT